MNRLFLVVFWSTMILVAAVIGCSEENPANPAGNASSLAYKGHENDADVNRFIAVYPFLAGTRLDDCQTCHKGGEIETDQGKISVLNPCSYCHLIPYPDSSIVTGAPRGYDDTLNPYGSDYEKAGRTSAALRSIASMDSDNDSHTNRDELEELRYPGDPGSKPGQPFAPIYTCSWSEITSLPSHRQFLLMNSHKQQFDVYATYGGARVKDLLAAAVVDLSNASSITFIAPDGFAKDLPLAEIDAPFPPGLYFANLDPGSFSDPEQGFVLYPPPEQIPPGLTDGGTIPGEQWLMIAYSRDHLPLDEGYLDPVSGKLNGEGPYRLIVPQSAPGAPDRGSKFSPSGYNDGYDYDESKDHNAGLCVRGLVAIRVNPMPDGYEEFDWKNGGWALISKKQLIIYGSGVTGD